MPLLQSLISGLRKNFALQYYIIFALEIILTISLQFSQINIPPLGKSVANLHYLYSYGFASLSFAIFHNNLTIATYTCIPIIGVFLFFLSTIQSGLAASSYAFETHQTILQELSLYAHPAVWIELSAYPIGLMIGIRLLMMLLSSSRRNLEYLKGTLFLYFFLALILAIAALLEAADIRTSPMWWYSHFYIFWLIGSLAITAIMYIYKRLLKPNLKIPNSNSE